MVSPPPKNPPPVGSEDTPPPTAFGTRSRETWKHTAILVLGLAAAGWGIFLGGRWLAGVVATSLPYSVDQQIGSLAAGQYSTGATVCTNPELVGAVESIIARLGEGVDPEYRPLRITVLEDSTINAFALPGGYMFVLTGLLEEIEAPEELIGVLGHEIGHVVHRHGIRRIAQSIWVRFLFASFFGDLGSFGDLLAGQALNVMSLKFDRDQERESDRTGVDLMVKAGIPPEKFPAFFARLPSTAIPEWLSTHPHPEGRAEELKALIAAAPAVTDPWQMPSLEALKAPCHVGAAE